MRTIFADPKEVADVGDLSGMSLPLMREVLVEEGFEDGRESRN
jgi:hypothetical protein